LCIANITLRISTWKTVYHYFCIWWLKGIWDCINSALRIELRISYGREPEQSAAILDSQSVKPGNAWIARVMRLRVFL
jgi:hypothetical protein